MKMKTYDLRSAREEEIIREIKEWIENNKPHPEYKENEHLIEIQYRFFEGNVAKIKKHLSLYFKKRTQVVSEYDRYENIYEHIRTSYDTAIAGLLPEQTPLGHSVVVGRIINFNNDLNVLDGQMRAILVAETIQEKDLLGKKVIGVIDYSGIQLSFLLKLNIFAIQKAYKTWRDFAFIGCSEIHHINMPLHSYYIMNLANAILDEKLKRVNYYHTGDLTEFYEHVPQEIMPKEYGGNAPELKELSEKWYEETMKQCDPVIEHFKVLAKKAKKTKKTSSFYEIPFKLFGKLRRRSNAA